MKSIATAVFCACIAVCLMAGQSQAFGPCARVMPADVSYLPDVAECGHKAAAVLSGSFYNSFSIVMRDCANGDRDPCHRHAGTCGTNFSSPFKVQKIMVATVQDQKGNTKKAQVHCFKERGDAQVYKVVRRITIKRRNPVQSYKDIARICLKTRTRPVNEVSIVKVHSSRVALDMGWNSACRTQPYLGCKIDVVRMCAGYGG